MGGAELRATPGHGERGWPAAALSGCVSEQRAARALRCRGPARVYLSAVVLSPRRFPLHPALAVLARLSSPPARPAHSLCRAQLRAATQLLTLIESSSKYGSPDGQ